MREADKEPWAPLSIEIAEAVGKLHEATVELARAQVEESKACSRTCAERNRVNEAQQKIDRLLAELKKGAPRESDWNRSKGTPVGVSA